LDSRKDETVQGGDTVRQPLTPSLNRLEILGSALQPGAVAAYGLRSVSLPF
jgi:hypothetical protein